MTGKKVLLLLLVLTQIVLIASPSLHSPQPVKALTSNPISSVSAIVPITGPLRKSAVNPRYFAGPSGNIVYLTGSHTWCNFMDCGGTDPIITTFDYPAFLDFLVARNHNFFRLWRAENARGGEAGPDFWFSPMPYQRSGTCCAFDGGNKFDLTRFNQPYFDRLRQRVIEAGNKGIYVSIMLFDGWSVESKTSNHNPWAGHPYKLSNNINNVNGDLNNDNQGGETHTLSSSQITALQEAYVRKVIDSVNDLDNVLYEISNESTGSAANTQWQYHLIDYIKSYEAAKPKQHPVGMTATWPNYNANDLYNSPADWISLGSNVNLNTYVPPAATGNKVILADTDHLCGICGNRQWVWKSFTRGENPIFMDVYNFATSSRGANLTPTGNEVDIRNNLGYTRTYASRIDLAAMTPQPNLCSTGFCLAKASSSGAHYLVYLPTGGSVNVDLSVTQAIMAVEWFNPSTGGIVPGGSVNGGGNRTLSAPFSGDAVVRLYPLDRVSVGVFRPSNGVIFLKNTNSTGFADIAINYGIGGDYPIAGDWNGDGVDTIGVYRNGSFYLRNANTVGYADLTFPFGSPGNQPIAGDWNGDGIDTIGVFDRRTFTFYLRNSNSAGPAEAVFALGIPGDIGIAGDWNGDGKDTVGVFRPSNGVIFLKNTNQTGFADIAINYGVGGDKPVTGDWNNDGIDTIGVLRGNTFLLRNSNTVGFADISFALGVPGDMPIAGNWDGLP